ncbi:MAG: tetratricopeptide repeat protein [Bryobacteraceae bacterium]
MTGAALVLLLAAPVWGANEECRPCHTTIVEAFGKTGMGRSIQERPVSFDGEFYHKLSNRHYQVANGVMRRFQLDGAKQEINKIEKRVDFAIGSGNHAVTYVHRTDQGRLLELPLSWYRSLNGWGMSPGYDSPVHQDMRREISDACLFCHAGYPESREARARPRSINCTRCHGPAEAHLKKPVKGTIVNPARLPAARRLEVCLQCHLETVSQGIADSFRQPGRDVFSFRPGEALESYKVYFDRADAAEPRFEVNHAGYRLLKSACYRKSGGRMTCTTCHDPHTARARNGCIECHQQVKHSRQVGTDCAACHMGKRATNDAPHVVMTDHWIRVKPAETKADHAAYQGPVVPFYTKADADTLAMANIRLPDAAAVALYERRLARDGKDIGARAALANTLLRLGRREAAISEAERVLRQERDHVGALLTLGVARAMAGEHARALELLQRAQRANPDHALTWLNLGVTHVAMGQREEAERAFREAIRLQPDFAEARQRLAELGR